MTKHLNEDSLAEQPAIEWFRDLGYEYEFGPDIAPGNTLAERDNLREVVLVSRLQRSLERINPSLPSSAISDAVDQILAVEHPQLEHANKLFYSMLEEGVSVDVEDESGEVKGEKVKLIDFSDVGNNEFLVVNQFAVEGVDRVRRPDLVVFVNGLPLAIFEFKSPTREEGTIKSAYNQLMKQYRVDIPELFKYNQVLVVSDLFETRHGTITSSWEWFSNWKGIEGEEEVHDDESQLEVTVNGMFHKVRFLDLIKNFIVFDQDKTLVKKMALYHQYYGVNKAVESTKRAYEKDGKIGVFWHTQGSGKSLSMVFYTNKTRKLKELKNPTFVFLTDRTDLDDQLYETFKRTNYPNAINAKSIKDLKKRLQTPAGDVIFTTIQKFDSEEGEKYPKLSDRENVIVVADEAHRSQYSKLAGNVRGALPKASFIGFTATPVELKDRFTRMVFGDYVSKYPINKAVDDGATVRIFYESRLVPLHLTNNFIDEEFDDLTGKQKAQVKEKLKRKWTRLEEAIGSEKRLKKVANDIVNHYNNRAQEGKAMIVTASRKIAVKMYQLISSIESAPESAVVVSGLSDYADQVQDETNVKELEERFKDPDGSLEIAIVCDMWLTGFDIPCLTHMYFDKPIKNHTLMQAIARVNRVFEGKTGGVIVDYIGIADNLKKSLDKYSSDIQEEAMVPIDEAIDKMKEELDIVRGYLNGIKYEKWNKLGSGDLAKLMQKSINQVTTNSETGKVDEEKKEEFLKHATKLFKLFALIMPHKAANSIRDEVAFIQAVKKSINKRTNAPAVDLSEKLESEVKQLISKSISAGEVVDIFEMKGKDKPDFSIFSDKFLKEVKEMEHKNVAIQVLDKLINDEIKLKKKKNVLRYQSLTDSLRDLLDKYENNLIKTAEVIEKLVELAKEVREVESEGEQLGLSDEEKAFYDAVAQGKEKVKNDEELVGIAKEVALAIQKDLTVDWTNQEMIKARIRSNVKKVLLREDFEIEKIEIVMDKVMRQASSLYSDWVPSEKERHVYE